MESVVFDSAPASSQWDFLQSRLSPASRTGRPRAPLRAVIKALLSIAKAGCQWRLLPKTFPPWQTIYHIFRRWLRNAQRTVRHDQLRAHSRQRQGHRCRPTAAILDSQTVRSARLAAQAGYDAARKTKGRKRFALVDTLGHPPEVVVFPADTQDREGGHAPPDTELGHHGWLRKMWANSSFNGPELADDARTLRSRLEIEVAPRLGATTGFKVLPERWVVERTFAWLIQNRRLARDDERTPESVAGGIHLAIIGLMVRRFA